MPLSETLLHNLLRAAADEQIYPVRVQSILPLCDSLSQNVIATPCPHVSTRESKVPLTTATMKWLTCFTIQKTSMVRLIATAVVAVATARVAAEKRRRGHVRRAKHDAEMSSTPFVCVKYTASLLANCTFPDGSRGL